MKRLVLFVFVTFVATACSDSSSENTNTAYNNPQKRVTAEQAVNKLIGESRSCTSNSECILVNLGCPYGCGIGLNSSSASKVVDAVKDYHDTYPACMYKCVSPTTVSCRENECVANLELGSNVEEAILHVDISSLKKVPAVVRAEELLELLRKSEWRGIKDYIALDTRTRESLDIPNSASAQLIEDRIAVFFEQLYGQLKPGKLSSVRPIGGKSDEVMVSYRHGDLDGFKMKRISEVWFYTLE